MMKIHDKFRFALLMATALTLSPTLSQANQANIDNAEYLVVNNPRVKNYDFSIGNVTVGDPRVVDFKADREKNRITLFPKNSGSTLLLVFDQKGTQRDAFEITVYSRDPNRLLDQVRTLLVGVEGISIRQLNNQIVIDGKVFLPSDKKRIQKVVANAKSIIDLTEMSDDTSNVMARKIQSEIGLDEVRVRSVRGQIVLEGEVYSAQASLKAEKIAGLYADRVINVLDVREVPRPPTSQPTIQITAHFIELAKTYAKDFNFRWNPIPNLGTSLSYAVNPVSGSNNFSGTISGTANNILPKLNYFRSLGIARVLENPSVSVKSGEVATIESGTKVGFPVAQGNGTVSLEFEDVGARLKIRPYARGADIDMEIDIKISSLGAPTVSGSISIDQSAIQTTQIVRSGESVVVGGLVRQSVRQSFDRPPSGQDLGISGQGAPGSGSGLVDPFPLGSLFTLFKSTSNSQDRTQFLVFITPTILKFSKDSNRELKDQFNLYEVYPDEGSSVDNITNDLVE